MINIDENGLLSELGPLLAVVVPDTVRTDMYLLGELDFETAQILDTLIEQQIATGHLDVRLDLSRLGFCDVRGLHALVRARRRLDAVGGQLVLRRPSPLLARIAGLCGVQAELGLANGEATPPDGMSSSSVGASPTA